MPKKKAQERLKAAQAPKEAPAAATAPAAEAAPAAEPLAQAAAPEPLIAPAATAREAAIAREAARETAAREADKAAAREAERAAAKNARVTKKNATAAKRTDLVKTQKKNFNEQLQIARAKDDQRQKNLQKRIKEQKEAKKAAAAEKAAKKTAAKEAAAIKESAAKEAAAKEAAAKEAAAKEAAKKAAADKEAAKKAAADKEAAKLEEDKERAKKIGVYMERPQGTDAIRDIDIMRRIDLEAKKETPFKNTEPVVIHTFKPRYGGDVSKTIQIKSKSEDFNSNILKEASPTAILNILKDKNKIEEYYSSNIANNSPEFTPQEMRETLICILLIRIIENIIYICSNDTKNVKPPQFKEFITELHSKQVIPLNASNIETLITIITRAIKLLDQTEENIAKEGEAILALTIWKFTLNLDINIKASIIKPILENIKNTLETEKNSIQEKIKAPNKIPGDASRPGTRQAQRAGYKSKSNRTRKKKLKN